MKTSPGLAFTLAALALLGAGLAGGQVWAMTGSVALAVAAGVVGLLGLGLAARRLAACVGGSQRRVFGEYRGVLEESEFVDVVDTVGDEGPRRTIQRGVQERPERVADSIRSLLSRPDTGARRGPRRS